MALESLIADVDQTPKPVTPEVDETMTIDDLVGAEDVDYEAPAPKEKPAEPAPTKKPAAKATPPVVPPVEGIPTDLTDAPEEEEEPYNIDTDEGVSDELRADIKKQPQKTQDAFAAQRIRIRELEALSKNAKGGLSDDEKAALVEENRALQERIEKADFVKSPRFQREYVTPMNAVQKEMIEAGKEYGIDAEDMKKALGMDRVTRADFLGEKISNQHGLSEILPLCNQYGAMLQRAKDAVEGHNTAVSASIAIERDNQAKALASNINAARDALFAEGYTLLRDSKQNPEWLPGLKAEAAKIVAGEVEPEMAAQAALRSVISKHQIASLSSQLTASQAEVDTLRTKLSKYVTLSPKGGGDRSTNTPASLDPETATIDDLVG